MTPSYLYNSPPTKARRRALRSNSTDAERKLWVILRGKRMEGLKFVRQYSVGPYVLDFFCPERRFAVEVDGGQHAEEAQRGHDEHRTSYLGMNEIRVLRFWNNEVLGNLDGVATKIRGVLDVLSRNPSQPPLTVRGGAKTVPPLTVRGDRGELRSDRNPSQPPLTVRGGARNGFTLLELIVVIAIFLLISGMLLANFRRSRQGDIVRIAALRLTTDIQRMQSTALSGGVGDRAAVAYGMHADVAQPDRYILFGDRTRCEGPQDAQVCRADGRYNASVDPVEEIEGGVVSLPKNVRIVDVRTVNPDAAISAVDALFRPPRGTVAITPDTTEVRIVLRHMDFDDTRTVTVNRISGRVSIE